MIISFNNKSPLVDKALYIDKSSVIIGDVTLLTIPLFGQM